MMRFIDGDEYDARTRAATACIAGSDQACAAQGEDRRNERRWLATASWLDDRRSTRSRQNAARESGFGRARREARCSPVPRMRRLFDPIRASGASAILSVSSAADEWRLRGTSSDTPVTHRNALAPPARRGRRHWLARVKAATASATGPSRPIRCVQFLPAPPALFPAMRPNTEPAIRPVPPG
jgi:hypothetical protein